MFDAETREILIEKLQRFVPTRYHDLNNWGIIIDRAELVNNDTLYLFKCSLQNVYLDKNTLEPVTYKEQHIIDGDYYYDYNTNDGDGAGTYNYINSVYKKDVYDLMAEEGIEYE